MSSGKASDTEAAGDDPRGQRPSDSGRMIAAASADAAARDPVPPCPTLAYARGMTVPIEDSALMLRYGSDDDVAAFETLYCRHSDGLYRYLLRLSGNRETAADLFQEVWARIIKARRRYRASAKFSTYLYRIAHNAFIDYLRRNKRYADGPARNPDDQPHAGAGPEAQTEQSLARRRLLAYLAELPVEQRDAFLLHEEAGLGLDQIAAVTGVPRETAKSRLRYAVAKLRKALSDPALGDEPSVALNERNPRKQHCE